ncbi:Uncharacterised protein [Salmonella enterica subsp. houtenae]|nr:Uncharacterised protein [Salmonella enterica subsp. houtenae]
MAVRMNTRGNGVRIRICTCMNGMVVRTDINIINLMAGTDAAIT